MSPDKNNAELGHDEIWDDSVLIDSWNDALAEYKKYHAIHARGGRVEDLGPSPPAVGGVDKSPQLDEAGAEEGPAQEEDGHGNVAEKDESWQEQVPASTASPAGPAVTTEPQPMAPPEAVLGSVRDEGLKKLLMAWYYAGYYTGLYEGQQQQQQPPPMPQGKPGNSE